MNCGRLTERNCRNRPDLSVDVSNMPVRRKFLQGIADRVRMREY
jgi:hypothetical protein